MVEELEYRTVQSTGKGSYIITLPKEWIQNLGLERGSHIALMKQEDSTLLLVPKKILEGRKEEPKQNKYRIFLELKDNPQSACRKITSLYVISADVIYVQFKGEKIPFEHKVAISELTKTLLGAEIIDETSNEITIQILVNNSEFPIEKAIRRMAILALLADRDAISALENMNEKLIEGVISLYNDVNRLNLYVIRQLKYSLERNLFLELGFKTPKEFLGYRVVINNIKSIADNALSLSNSIMALNKMIKDQSLHLNKLIYEEVYSQILNFNSKAHVFFDETLKALFKRDYGSADRLFSEIEQFVSLERENITLVSIKKMDPTISSILRLIIEGSRQIIEYSQNISEVTLHRTIEEISEQL